MIVACMCGQSVFCDLVGFASFADGFVCLGCLVRSDVIVHEILMSVTVHAAALYLLALSAE